MSQKVRTQLTDLPEVAVELTEKELRIVSGGLKPIFACYGRAGSGGVYGLPTNVQTGNDWDEDK